MDPLAHTLIGASLAETPLKRWTPMATPALILGANAPDIDAVTLFISGDVSLGFRRGWTHGILAIAVLPLLLTGLLLLLDRGIAWWRGRKPSARAAPLIALSYITVLTHPALDWLNTYGIRLLMPFNGQWFYGDALFIVDPWIWLLAGVPVILAHTHTLVNIGGWFLLGLLTTVFVTGFVGTPPVARLLWVTAVASIVTLRIWGPLQQRLPRVATGCLACVVVYILLNVVGSHIAEQQVRAWLAELDEVPTAVMTGPLPANPFGRDVVIVDTQHYHFLELNWLHKDRIRIASPSIDQGSRNAVVDAALAAPNIQGIMAWIRLPAYAVEQLSDGYRVTITDARYSRRAGTGLGGAIIDLDRDLRLR